MLFTALQIGLYIDKSLSLHCKQYAHQMQSYSTSGLDQNCSHNYNPKSKKKIVFTICYAKLKLLIYNNIFPPFSSTCLHNTISMFQFSICMILFKYVTVRFLLWHHSKFNFLLWPHSKFKLSHETITVICMLIINSEVRLFTVGIIVLCICFFLNIYDTLCVSRISV